MTNTMWGGRFAGGPAAIMEEINASIDFDRRLCGEDIAGSRAHARCWRHRASSRRTMPHAIRQGSIRSKARSKAARYLFAGAGGHPPQYREPPQGTDRAGGRAAAYGAVAQRPGGNGFPALCARRDRPCSTQALRELQVALAEKGARPCGSRHARLYPSCRWPSR